jgi:hypothetical protein
MRDRFCGKISRPVLKKKSLATAPDVMLDAREDNLGESTFVRNPASVVLLCSLVRGSFRHRHREALAVASRRLPVNFATLYLRSANDVPDVQQESS